MSLTEIDITETFKKWSLSLKEEFISNGKISSKRLVYTSVQKRFPDFISLLESIGLKDWFKEVMYCILKDVQHIPKCPVCGNSVPLRNYVIGFQKTCCAECSMKALHSKNVASKISKSLRTNYLKSCPDDSVYKKYDIEIDEEDRNYFNVHNYCKHGDIHIYRNTFYKIEKTAQSTFCPECNREIFDSYSPTEQEILDFQMEFPEFYRKNKHSLNGKWLMLYYPKKFKILKVYYEKYIDTFDETDPCTVTESYYVFINGLKSRPTCTMEGCDEFVPFQKTANAYSMFCKSHGNSYMCSGKEYELKEFIDSLGVHYKHNDRDTIDKELDFYFPDKHTAIEFNGCWFHSDWFKGKSYHRDKYLMCKGLGIKLMTVWEDDWTDKTDIVKGIIKDRLGVYETTVNSNSTVTKEIDASDAKRFLEENHLHVYSNSKYKYGLYSGDELVELMTLRMSRSDDRVVELTRLCTKLGWFVNDGADKLFSHFVKKHPEIEEVVAYIDCDVCDENIYESLGFKYEGMTDDWTWFYKGRRVNKTDKIERSKKEFGLHKCYSSGVMKFKWVRTDR